MTPREILKREFDAEEGSFLLRARCELTWDWAAFRRLTRAMYCVAQECRGRDAIETWVAQGFWHCDVFIREWTSHPNFPKPVSQEHADALGLIRDLAYFLFIGERPYTDDTLERLALK
ncbi:MAG TPA: hypothetical protein VF472_14575 [Burkholderiaceae bacterium]